MLREIYQQAGAGGGATASVYNTNAIAVTASANVTVGNAAHRGSYALATAAALGVSQSASGGTASATVTATAFTDAFGVGAYVSQHLVGVSFTKAVDGGSAPTGPALVTLTNTGTIVVLANASAVGEPGAIAFANATAVNQHAAALRQSLGPQLRDDLRPCLGIRFGSERGVATAHAAGVHQTANAAATNFHTSYYGTATLHRTSHATEGLAGFAYGTTTVRRLTTAATASSTNAPAGPALVTLTNSGAINVGAYATALNALGGPVIGAATVHASLSSAGALGVGQEAGGTEATLIVDNSGTIDVAANTYASGATAAFAGAQAQGIVQGGTALSSHRTAYATLGLSRRGKSLQAVASTMVSSFLRPTLYQTLVWTSSHGGSGCRGGL